MSKKAVVLLSGGLDSATVCGIASTAGYKLLAITFSYGQRHKKELECAKALAQHYGVREHLITEIDLGKVGGSSLTDMLMQVPANRGSSPEIPSTYVPARNTIFLSYALAVAEVAEADEIFIGLNAIDYSGYPDCRPEYVSAFQGMANLATKRAVEGNPILVRAPLLDLSKGDIVKWGLKIGVPYEKTWSCYMGSEKPCGQCDSCKLRAEGFRKAGAMDPVLGA